MAYNHAKAENEFLAMWKKKSAEYREAGMDEDSISEMYKLEREIFLSERREEEHRAEFSDISFYDTFSEEDFSGRYAWVDTLDNPKLAKAVKRLKRDDLNLLTMITIERYTQKEAAEILKVKPQTVNEKYTRIKIFLKKVLRKS